jgi:hypothetical protein
MCRIPALLFDPELLVPIKIDITFSGARYVDSFCWKLYDSMMSPEEFAARTCADLSLSVGFQHKIALQISEQITAYRDIISMFQLDDRLGDLWQKAIPEKIQMMIGIRFNCIDCNMIVFV